MESGMVDMAVFSWDENGLMQEITEWFAKGDAQ